MITTITTMQGPASNGVFENRSFWGLVSTVSIDDDWLYMRIKIENATICHVGFLN